MLTAVVSTVINPLAASRLRASLATAMRPASRRRILGLLRAGTFTALYASAMCEAAGPGILRGFQAAFLLAPLAPSVRRAATRFFITGFLVASRFFAFLATAMRDAALRRVYRAFSAASRLAPLPATVGHASLGRTLGLLVATQLLALFADPWVSRKFLGTF